MDVLTREACRRVDELAVARYGIPTIVLMENAARGLADVALGMMRRRPAAPMVVVCGPGNNGGDGLGAARWLANAGRRVTVVMLAEAATADARVQAGVVRAMPEIGRASAAGEAGALRGVLKGPRGLVIDCLFGTGLTRPLSGAAAGAVGEIAAARGRGWKVLAADVPSGLDADSGRPVAGGACVEADATATFAAMKPGLRGRGAVRYAGRVTVVDIGAPRALIQELALRR